MEITLQAKNGAQRPSEDRFFAQFDVKFTEVHPSGGRTPIRHDVGKWYPNCPPDNRIGADGIADGLSNVI